MGQRVRPNGYGVLMVPPGGEVWVLWIPSLRHQIGGSKLNTVESLERNDEHFGNRLRIESVHIFKDGNVLTPLLIYNIMKFPMIMSVY